MGSSYGRNPRTGGWVLNCGNCGVSDGTVRRRKCPAGYCPACQLCPTCYAVVKADGRWGEWHENCQSSSDAWKAQQAEEAAHPDRYPQAAWGQWHTKQEGVTLVLTKAGTFLLVPEDEYEGAFHTLPESAVPWTEESGVELPPGQTKRVA